MSTPKIIIEGSNLSGKTSIAKELEKEFVHSVVVTLHGYYHPKFLEQIKTPSAAVKYHHDRLNSFLDPMTKISAEELIFNRFHLTASVIIKLFYHIDEYFYDIEKILNDLNVYLILVDFNKEALEERLKERLKLNKEAPWGDGDFSKTKEKRDLYRYFFGKSQIKNKFLIDNSTITAQQVVKILKEETKNFGL